MFESHQKSTGVSYTPTVAFLAAAVLSPLVLIALRPFGPETAALAMGSSALYAALSWINWKRSSRLSIPSLMVQKRVAK